MEVLEVRQAIEASISGYLGTYTLPNGFVTPAISVRNTGESIPAGYKVSGLEAVLIRTPTIEVTNLYTDQIQQTNWSLYLVQWSGVNTINQAASKLQRDFQLGTYQELSVPESLGPREQGKFIIPAFQSPIAEGGIINSDINVTVTHTSQNPIALGSFATTDLQITSIKVVVTEAWVGSPSLLITDNTSGPVYVSSSDVDLLEVGEYEVFLEETLNSGRRLIAILDSDASPTGAANIIVSFADN